MMRVTIVFTSLLKLWDFSRVLRKRPVQINVFRRVITCDCTESEIKLAQFAFDEKVEKIG